MNDWVDARKEQLKLKMAIDGPTGTGKTFTALSIAEAIATYGNRIVCGLDTEGRKMLLYADRFVFKHKVLTSFSPKNYTEAVHSAEDLGADVLVIDSLSHAWRGKGGALEQVDAVKGSGGEKNSYTAWKGVTPLQNEMIEAINQSNIHIIVTMRSEMSYILEANAQGKMVPRRMGLAPVQRKDVEYEFDVIADMDQDHILTVTKTRCYELDQFQVERPNGIEFAQIVMPWLNAGIRPAEMATSLEHPVVQEWRLICRKVVDAGHDQWVIRRNLPLAVDIFIKDIRDLCLKMKWDTEIEAPIASRYGQPAEPESPYLVQSGLPEPDPNKQMIMLPAESDPTPGDEQAAVESPELVGADA